MQAMWRQPLTQQPFTQPQKDTATKERGKLQGFPDALKAGAHGFLDALKCGS
jgi:hypothetical protein